MIDPLTTIGLLAGACTTISFFPQIIKIYRTRQTRDLSLSAYSILCLGLFLWVVYGVISRQVAVILPNSIILCLGIYIIIMKIKLG